jgi:hypothetical protein
VEELDLGHNRLSRDTAEVLADALRKNRQGCHSWVLHGPYGLSSVTHGC